MHRQLGRSILLVGSGLALVACSNPLIVERSASDANRSERTTPAGVESPATTPSSAPTTTTTVPVAETIGPAAGENPVSVDDFPDPDIVATDTGYVAFSTNSRGRNVPVLTSTDLVHWTDAGDALAQLPSWANEGSVWAPSVTTTTTGATMYVTIGDSRRGRQCVFAATSSSVTGPYTVVDVPVVCGDGGSIDPTTVTDATGATWLVWKDEAVGTSTETRLRSARLGSDGTSIATVPTTLLTNTAAGVVNVEGPSLLRTAQGYTMFFSVGDWRSSTYRTGYATCQSLTSSCVVVSTDWLAATSGLDAPGGLEVFVGRDGTTTLGAFHTGSCADCDNPVRVLNVRRLDVEPTPTIR